MSQSRRILPAWVLGFGNLPMAVIGGVVFMAVPNLLASAHVPEAQIATVTSLFLIATFLSIPLSPLLDWRYSRRSYAIGFAILTSLCTFAALLAIPNVPLLACLLFMMGLSQQMGVNATGGWFGNLLPTEKKDTLAAWLNVVNFGFGGALTACLIYLLQRLPRPFGPAVIAALVLLVLPLLIVTPCPPADKKLASESFRNFALDVAALFRRKDVQRILVIFIAPSASFALTNTLAGFGRDFHTSNELVGVLSGAGVTAAGVMGALLAPRMAKRVSPVAVYLLVGHVGAAFTLSLIAAPRDPVVFGIAMLGQNLFQAAAFSASYVVTLRTIGEDNPLAATQFGVLIGVTMIPLAYMQMIDGHAYRFGGVAGTFAADALISGTACVVLALLYRRTVLKASLAEA